MSSLFTSGVFTQGQGAWHHGGHVVNGNLSPSRAFEMAEALFPVVKRSLVSGDLGNADLLGDLAANAYLGPDAAQSALARHLKPVGFAQAVVRGDTGAPLGVVSPQYQVIPNERLLDLANALREEADISAVVVLKGGARVAFTSIIRGAESLVIPGDRVRRHFVGFLGHDGKTSFSGGFSDVRIVCQNTLNAAINQQARDASSGRAKFFTIHHHENQIDHLESIIQSIDFARQSLNDDLDFYRRMADTPMNTEMFRHFLEFAYQVPAVVKQKDGTSRRGTIEDMPRKWDALKAAFEDGFGVDIPGVKGSLWHGFNAITEVESSPINLTAANRIKRFSSSQFGSGSRVINRAALIADQLAVR